jgi:hypothetical protein
VDIFRRRILAKLIVILIVAVSVISIVSILYFDRRNREALKRELQDTVSNLGEMGRLAYANPMWQMARTEIAYINRALLTNRDIVAVNIYDESGRFVDSLRKNPDTMEVGDDVTPPPYSSYPKAQKTSGRSIMPSFIVSPSLVFRDLLYRAVRECRDPCQARQSNHGLRAHRFLSRSWSYSWS